MTPQEQRWAASLSLALLSAVLAPIRRNWSARPRDGFPFSHYPMFSARRRATTTVHYLAGVTAGGERIRLPYRFAGTVASIRSGARSIAWWPTAASMSCVPEWPPSWPAGAVAGGATPMSSKLI